MRVGREERVGESIVQRHTAAEWREQSQSSRVLVGEIVDSLHRTVLKVPKRNETNLMIEEGKKRTARVAIYRKREREIDKRGRRARPRHMRKNRKKWKKWKATLGAQ